MPVVTGIRFKPVTKVYYFDPNGLDLQAEDRVIVETSRGTEMGTVVLPLESVHGEELKGPLKKVIRKATPLDLLEAERFRAKEPEAMAVCREHVKKLGLSLKVIQVEYSFDGSRLICSFVAEQRVDFRHLVKELTRALHTRIEMKQVGARDETKILDGYGRCGRQLCCSSWLTDFHPVSIRMAKNQSLPLAPSEISGVCGRLLCCLAYENEHYTEVKKSMPKVNSYVQTSEGVTGKVKGLNVLKETLLLNVEGQDNYVEVPAAEVSPAERAQDNKQSGSDDNNKKDDGGSSRSKKSKRRRRRRKKSGDN